MSRRVNKESLRNCKDGWDEWGGYMNAKIQKLESQFESEVRNKSKCVGKQLSDIFKGISIFVNGYTKPPSDVLKKLMQQHGGTYYHYYGRDKVSHIIATNLPNSKIAALTDQKVVKPEWITESIAANKLLPYESYLLYTAKSCVQPSLKTQVTGNNSGSIVGHSIDISKSVIDDTSSVNNSKFSINVVDHNPDTTDEHVIGFDAFGKDELSIKADQELLLPAKAGHPNFVAEFYSHSRLHHISSWGAECKAYVSSLQENLTVFPAKEQLAKIAGERISDDKDKGDVNFGRVIMHIDMDCFFVSVGIRNKPHFKDKPVAVTHSKGHGRKEMSESNDGSGGTFHSMAEIASCSYEARKCGVKNGMFMGQAKKLCPELIAIPYDFEGYSEVSKILYNCVASLTCDIEAVSCDELFVDCTSVLEDTGATPLELASMIREEIYIQTMCSSSAGLGPNILVSRLATRKAKPNGQCFIGSIDVCSFMRDQPIENLPGVGRKLRKKFEDLHIFTCGDLQAFSRSSLQKHFGPKTAETFYKFCRGEDDRQIQSEKVRKSVSAEINYGIRFTGWEQANTFVSEVAEEVTKRLKAVGSTGKAITLKIKIRSPDAPKETAKYLGHGVCNSYAKTVTLPVATDCVEVIKKESLSLLRIVNPDVTDIRGLGIQISKLEKPLGTKSKGLPSILQYTYKQSDPCMDSKPAASAISIETDSEDVKSVNNKSDEDILKFGKHSAQITEQTEGESTVSVDNISDGSQISCTLPPLPCLPDILSPSPRLHRLAFSTQDDSISSSPEIPIVTHTASSIKASNSNYHGVFPSPSQIDHEVLMALPSDIRNEILNEQKNNQRKQEDDISEVVPVEDVTAGCSHWVDVEPLSPRKVLDVNTLKQAPEGSPRKSPRGKGRGRGGAQSSPSRNSNKSPSKNSAKFKVPQGKPPKIKQQSSSHSNPKKQLFVDEPSTSEHEATVEQSGVTSKSLEDVNLIKVKPNLCGATTLEDVKSLIKQWVNESPEPNEEDLMHFLKYLTELLEDNDLEQLLFTLRHLIRQSSRTSNKLWKTAATEIVTNIQMAIQSVYGSVLKI